MINYSHQYIQDYSTISAPLRKLTRKGEPYVWTVDQEAAFNTLKEKISAALVMAFYNPKAETELTVDASPVGLGAILTQQQTDGSYKPVAYGSRALIDTESRYRTGSPSSHMVVSTLSSLRI